MEEVKKMIRVVINGQSSLKQELLGEIGKVRNEVIGVDNKLNNKFDSLRSEMRQGFKKVNDRLDKQGKSLAYLEDDAPIRKEHEGLEKRVRKIETNLASI